MKRLVLAGAGLTHLEVLRRLAARPIDTVEIVLVAEQETSVYAGMLPGVVAGHYAFEAMTVDVQALAKKAGVVFQTGKAAAIAHRDKKIILEDETALDFSVLSLNTGASARMIDAQAPGEMLAIKPAPQFLQDLANWEMASSGLERVAVIGGGVAGIEMILALAFRWQGTQRTLMLIERSGRKLANVPRAARSYVLAALEAANVSIVTSSGDSAIDLAINAGGAAAPAWLARTGLPRDANGYLAIRPTLQSEGSDIVFASGDMATITAYPRSKAGVFAVRQGPVLFDNLMRVLNGQAPKPHHPQKDWLSLIATGDRHAIAVRNGVALSGRWAWWLKDINDRSFLARYRKLTGQET